ncbi:MAG TPA: hypothetical protein VGB73_13710 [Pyrinomonadaceae bacterium]|jgi:thymidylate kinase
MLITFSGLDGAGKTTLIECLRESLEQRGVGVSVAHMYYDVGCSACLRFVLRKLGRSSASVERSPLLSKASEASKASKGATRAHAPREFEEERGGKSTLRRVGSALIWNRTLRLCVYPLDVLLFLARRLYAERLKGRVLIMDRYFYDTLVDVSGGRKGYAARLLWLLTPKPTLPVYLDISAEEAHARKPEHGVEHLRRRRLSYQGVVRRVPGMLVVEAGDDLGSTRRSLEKRVLELLSARPASERANASRADSTAEFSSR